VFLSSSIISFLISFCTGIGEKACRKE